MVLGAGQRQHRLAVGKGQQRALRALEHLLDHDGLACLAKGAREALAHAGEGLLGGLGHDDALASGQTVSLDDAGAIELAHVGLGGPGLGEALVAGRGNAGALHDLLGEELGALHLRGVAVGTKAGDAGGAHRVAHALDERGLRADDHETDTVRRSEVCHGDGVVLVEALGEGCLGEDAAVAGRSPELAGARALDELA